MKSLFPYTIHRIKQAKARYEVHSFDSEAIMIDIWIDKNFYVIQIDGDAIGLILVTEETTPFNIIPDQTFKDVNDFKKSFENIFGDVTIKKQLL